ncbi:aminotransferase class IV, partial [Escherichia coli]
PNTIPTAAKAGGNYLSSLLVGSEARRHGYQEGIALDVNGYISEGAGENLFEVKDGVLFTPPFTSSARYLPDNRGGALRYPPAGKRGSYHRLLPRLGWCLV